MGKNIAVITKCIMINSKQFLLMDYFS